MICPPSLQSAHRSRQKKTNYIQGLEEEITLAAQQNMVGLSFAKHLLVVCLCFCRGSPCINQGDGFCVSMVLAGFIQQSRTEAGSQARPPVMYPSFAICLAWVEAFYVSHIVSCDRLPFAFTVSMLRPPLCSKRG